jgi:N6-adenosine-specific RNA methylase IME4
VKPSGFGCWFAHRTQTILFGYRERCRFPLRRYAGNVIQTTHPARHSEKPEEAFALIEAVSPGPRLELFARRARPGWTVWGNEVPCKANTRITDSGKG